jgi:tetratricopeptide (TPR) repeat protein
VAVLLVAVTVAVTVGMVILGGAYADREAALVEAQDRAEAENTARLARDQAVKEVEKKAAQEKALRLARDEALKDARARTASEQAARVEAEEARGQAVQAMRTLVVQVQNMIRDTGGMRPLRRVLLKEAMTVFNDLAREDEGQQVADRHLATAYQHMAEISTELGDAAQARTFLQRSIDIYERVAKANPNSPRDLAVLGLCLARSVNLYLTQTPNLVEARKRAARSLAFLDRARAEARHLADDPRLLERRREHWYDPRAIDRHRVDCLNDLGLGMQYSGDLTAAKKHYLAALAIHQAELVDLPPLATSAAGLLASTSGYGSLQVGQRFVARQEMGGGLDGHYSATRTLVGLGEVAIRAGDVAGMHDYFQRSFSQIRNLRRLDPASLKYRWGLAVSAGRYAELCVCAGDPKRADEQGRMALRLARDLRDIDPGSAEHDALVALMQYRLGVVVDRMGEHDRALAQFMECRRICLNLERFVPGKLAFQKLMLAQARVGEHAAAAKLAAGLRVQAAKNVLDLVAIASAWAVCVPEVGRNTPPEKLTEAEKSLRKKYSDTAIAVLREAVALGYADWGALQIEVDFEPVRSLPEFKALVAKLKQGTR